MKNNLLLSLHEKAIAVLEAYYQAERMYYVHEKDIAAVKSGHINPVFGHHDYIGHCEKRMAVNAAIMARLQAYYGRIIEKINTHKP